MVTGCLTQSLMSPFMDPDAWCRSINSGEGFCHQDTCVECIDRGCPIERPFCVDFKCVECEERENCWEGRECIKGVCVHPELYCAHADDPDDWCQEYTGLPICDTDRSECVECIDKRDCLDSAMPQCYNNSCVQCADNDHCGLGTKCDLQICVEGCDDNLDCPADKPYCSQRTGKCEECWSPQHCDNGYNCLDYHCVWVGCEGEDSNCPKEYYCVNDNCVLGCGDSENCSNQKPHCSRETGKCEECVGDPHCPEDYVCFDYGCIREDELPPIIPGTCEYPGDCGDNYICIYGSCYEGCVGNTFCAPETPICSYENTQTVWRTEDIGTSYGQCVECETPEDCNVQGREGLICVRGKCEPDIPIAEWECERDIECSPGVCEHFKCIECRDKSTCPPGWGCDNNVCVKGCEGPEDCPDDKPHCSQKWRYCVECWSPIHCPDGYDCDDNSCVWIGCEGKDMLCPLGFWCDIDECVEGCRNPDNCPPGKPYCSRATGKCEECFGFGQCPDGYDCVDYNCVWVGLDCEKDNECPKGEWCPSGKCEEGCGDNSNCPDARPHCSQATGKCEECWGKPHCPPGQDCISYHCEEMEAVCVDKYDCKHGERCKHGTCIKIECHNKPDCDAGEWCDDGVCKSYTEECGTGCADGYFCNEETNRCERIECKTYKECGEGECCETISDVNRCVPCEAAKCDALHRCRKGWTCDLSIGLCAPKSCASPAGCPEGYICDEIAEICVPIKCTETSDPDEYCNKQFGIGWKCDFGIKQCMKVACDLVDDPDGYCRYYYGSTYGCRDNECIELGYYDFPSPDEYCKTYRGEYWRWDFVSETCEVTPCDLYDNPDEMCAKHKGEWYICIEGECGKLGEGYACDVSPQCDRGLRCKYGFCHEIECEQPWECTSENETCVDGLCIATTRDCEIPGDCDSGYFCNKDGRCEKRVCETNMDCRLDYCCLYPYGAGVNVETECVPCGEGFCDDTSDCPLGWECNLETEKCERRLCDSPEECGLGYDCLHGYCIAFNCTTAEDPLSFCQKWWGEYTYCNMDTTRCEERKCNDYPHPRDICEEQLGEKFKCDWSTGECRYKEISDFDDLDLFCRKMNENEWWYWDADRGECRLPTKCDTVYNPDAFCEETVGPGYRCVIGICRRGQEGDKCDIPEDCGLGFACGAEGICVKKECYIDYNCARGRWCDDGVCKDNDNICIDDSSCRDGWFCDLDNGRCSQKDCMTHEGCDGECCFGGWCIPCEECPCEHGSCPTGWECVRGYCSQRECEIHAQCPRGFYCDRNSGKCTIDEEYDLIRKCLDDSYCEPGEVCLGAYSGIGIPDPWHGAPFITVWGRCSDPARGAIVEIKGVIDDETCDYCLDKIGKFYYLDQTILPPFHGTCRCWAEIHS